MSWYTEGEKTNPSSGTVLADTGELSSGGRAYGLIVSASVNVKVLVQHRNAANDANVKEQVFHSVSELVVPAALFDTYVVTSNERVRVVTSGTVVGAVQASLFGY